MKRKTIAERIRAITDAATDYLIATAIHGCMARPRPSLDTVRTTLSLMEKRDQIERRRRRSTKPGRAPFEFRSGPNPVTPSNGGRKKRERLPANLGFRALGRLKKSNPAEWARLTNGGRL